MNKTKTTTNHLPSFLGIGAARAGTTWLSDKLMQHPEIWMPRRKELHYFTRSEKYFGPSHLDDADFQNRLVGHRLANRQYRKALLRAVGSNLAKPSPTKLRWDLRYFLGSPSDHWYASLFAQGAGKVTGEITPRYSALDVDDIRALRTLIPDLKILFILREPVSRIWSLIKYHEKRQQIRFTEKSTRELSARALHPAVSAQSDYESILARWQSVFPKEKVLTVFYDDLCAQPNVLLHTVSQFLEVDGRRFSFDKDRISDRINPSFDKEIPSNLQQVLTTFYRPMVRRLSDTYGGHFTSWLDSYDSVEVDDEPSLQQMTA